MLILSRFHIFQSTLPREERLFPLGSAFQGLYFNPRFHERSDYAWQDKKGNIKSISIHASTRGATAILHKKFVYFYTIPTINI